MKTKSPTFVLELRAAERLYERRNLPTSVGERVQSTGSLTEYYAISNPVCFSEKPPHSELLIH